MNTSTNRLTLLFVTLAVIFVAFAAKPSVAEKPTPLIEDIGNYSFFQGVLTIKVAMRSMRSVGLNMRYQRGAYVREMSFGAIASASDPWFLYVVSLNEVWVYRGDGLICLLRPSIPPPAGVPKHYSRKDLPNNTPPEFRARLLRKLGDS